MYKIIVEEREQNSHAPFWQGKPLAAEDCRISALSSADYCLHNRVDVAWGRISWKGNKMEISRLFEAERLNSSALEQLKDHREYTVLFLNPCAAGCA